jgi:hypothetical protein
VDRKYSNVFTYDAPDPQTLALFITSHTSDFQALYLQAATLTYARISTAAKDGVNYLDVPLNVAGSLVETGPIEPSFVAVRATCPVGLGRPGSKWLRHALTDNSVDGYVIEDAVKNAITNALRALEQSGEVQGGVMHKPKGRPATFAPFTGVWVVEPLVRSRQVSRRRRRKTTLPPAA